MTVPGGYRSWDELYATVEAADLPWHLSRLDPDLDDALARHGITSGRALDQGCGRGTQAIALAQRGFDVTGSDVSPTALAAGARAARRARVNIRFVQDDVLATRLSDPFDLVFDRGCLHVFPPALRPRYVRTVRKLIVPAGWLFIKTFSHLMPGTLGPYRFHPDDIFTLFEDDFEIVELLEAVIDGPRGASPKAYFGALRRRRRTRRGTVDA
jgi:SAM-dependent methyltransferase